MRQTIRHLTQYFLLLTFLWMMAENANAKIEELTATEIMLKVDQRDTGKSSATEAQFILIDKKGRQRVRRTKGFMKKYGDDQKDISIFYFPPDIEGTGFLNYSWGESGKDDDIWMYLPAINRTKRLPSSDRAGSFMGTDFSYADFERPEVDYYNYRFVDDVSVIDDHEVWVIEREPKEKYKDKVLHDTGYIKSQLWIRKDILFPVKSKHWVQKGQKIKLFEASDLENVNGVWIAKRRQMKTLVNGQTQSSTTMKVTSANYNIALDDNLFQIQRLERGY